MKRNRNDNAKKERIIMLASSAFVLAALTMTGIYMQSKNAESEDDGYTLDFTAMEDNVENKYQEIARGDQSDEYSGIYSSSMDNQLPDPVSLDDDLDYMPLEAGSGLIQIPGLTDGLQQEADNTEDHTSSQGTGDSVKETDQEQTPGEETSQGQDTASQESVEDTETDQGGEDAAVQMEGQEVDGGNVVVTRTLHFAETDGLLRPLEGEVVIPYSMESSVYFSTLDQYKYNPALMISAAEGTTVTACAEGRVIDIFQNEEIGHAITMELGDGYQIIYGQLKDIQVTLGSYVDPGMAIATVAAPTKYFTVEGSNLYLKLTAEGTPVDPELLFR